MQQNYSFVKSRDFNQTKKYKVQFLQSNLNRLQKQHQILANFRKQCQLDNICVFLQHMQTSLKRLQILQHQAYQLNQQKYQQQQRKTDKNVRQIDIISEKTSKVKKKLAQLNEKIDQEMIVRSQLQQKRQNVRYHNNMTTRRLQSLPQKINHHISQLKNYSNKKIQQKQAIMNKQQQIQTVKILTNQQIVNIKRQLGLLKCQISFYQYQINKNYWEQQISKVSQHLRQKNREQVLGIFQLRILNDQYDNTITNNTKRLIYQLNIQECKINSLHQKYSGSFERNQGKVERIQRRIFDIQVQSQGLKRYEYNQKKKIHRIQKLLNQFFHNTQINGTNVKKDRMDSLADKLNFLKKQLTSLYF